MDDGRRGLLILRTQPGRQRAVLVRHEAIDRSGGAAGCRAEHALRFAGRREAVAQQLAANSTAQADFKKKQEEQLAMMMEFERNRPPPGPTHIDQMYQND